MACAAAGVSKGMNRRTGLRFDTCLGASDLPLQRMSVEPCEIQMVGRVRADFEAGRGEATNLLPGHQAVAGQRPAFGVEQFL